MPSAKASQPQKDKNLRRDSGTGVEDYILPSAGAGWNETLVPLIQAGYERSHEDRDAAPSHRPQTIPACRKSLAPGAKCQDAKDGVADDVSAFANVEVPFVKMFPVEAEEIMKQWVKNAAGIAGRKQGGRFNGDDDQPKERGDPCFQKIVAAGVQAREPRPGWARRDSRRRLSQHKLFDGIIGGLSGDHDIVNVTLAKSGSADAHEAGFLQEFADGGAAAVSHA